MVLQLKRFGSSPKQTKLVKASVIASDLRSANWNAKPPNCRQTTLPMVFREEIPAQTTVQLPSISTCRIPSVALVPLNNRISPSLEYPSQVNCRTLEKKLFPEAILKLATA